MTSSTSTSSPDRRAIELRNRVLRPGLGPLVVSLRNPRNFTHCDDDTGVAVYLTGSHIWNSLQAGMGPGAESRGEPERMDFDAYLRFLTERGHNLIPPWRWEQFRSQAAGGSYHLDGSPQPWARTDPGPAKDGKPRFDLERFDDAFSRLRDRVERAGAASIYVDVLLLDGCALHLSPPPDSIEGHPFHARNNVNGVSAASIDDLQVMPLDPQLEAIQRAFVTKVVDTLHDLPNVLWEVANQSSGGGSVTEELAGFLGMTEPPSWGDSTGWQYSVIDVVRRHERNRGYDPHPIGMTMQFPVPDQRKVNEPLLASEADWISPGYDDERFTGGRHPREPGVEPPRWFADPPVADGRKVMISDTDHYAPGGADPLWAWKSFLRGHRPSLMDFGLLDGARADVDGRRGDRRAAVRLLRGHVLRNGRHPAVRRAHIAGRHGAPGGRRVDRLRDRVPGPPGSGAPAGERRAVHRDPGPDLWSVEWFDVTRRETTLTGGVEVSEPGPVTFSASFDGPAVLHLRA